MAAGIATSAEGWDALRRLTDVAVAVAAEDTDGPKWAEAVREGRRLRERAAEAVSQSDPFSAPYRPWSIELSQGIPVGWWGRP